MSFEDWTEDEDVESVLGQNMAKQKEMQPLIDYVQDRVMQNKEYKDLQETFDRGMIDIQEFLVQSGSLCDRLAHLVAASPEYQALATGLLGRTVPHGSTSQ